MKQINIDHILPFVKKPARYIGGELNAIYPDADSYVNFCLVFPDLYEIGMSHQGLQILYHLLNGQDGVSAERCYTPDLDMEEQLRSNKMPLFSIESRRSLAEFDVIGFTLPYELCYTNILTVLELAGIPFRSADRDESHPLVFGGGSCSMNPEPVADFFDAIVIGDGEEVIAEITQLLIQAKKNDLNKQTVLESLSEIEGVYIPSFFEPEYTDSKFCGIKAKKSGYQKVTRRILAKFPEIVDPSPPLVPLVKTVHDRLGVEIARGCTRGCRFCQAGVIYRPVRERSVDDIMKIARQGIDKSGFDELALLSLSTGDYSCLGDLMPLLMDTFVQEYVSVSMPSMRVGTLTDDVMNQVKRVRKTGFTVAPEAGTDRLRQVINKGISRADLLETCRNAFGNGWNLIKFYFMIGLPTETLEDVEAIVELSKSARMEAGTGKGGKAQVNVSISTFVPKPHTPFQWEAQLSLEESKERINLLKKHLPRRGFKLKWHDPDQSFLEGVFSRGDRKLSALLESAWQSGVRLDSWSEHYSLEKWQEAATSCSIDLESYLRKRQQDEILPWSHLESGVDPAFLTDELNKSQELTYTPDCRVHGCQKCGLCDFKKIAPVSTQKDEILSKPDPKPSLRNRPGKNDNVVKFSYRVHYSRLAEGKYLGHLELLQLIFRAVRLAELPVLFSRGFNPSPCISFSPALPVGVESEAEYFDMDLESPVGNSDKANEDLNRYLPDFIKIHFITAAKVKTAETIVTYYEIKLPFPLTPEQKINLDRFFASDSFIVERIRKRKKRELDIRPLVRKLVMQDGILLLELINHQSIAGSNPREVLVQVVGLDDKQALLAGIKKIRMQ